MEALSRGDMYVPEEPPALRLNTDTDGLFLKLYDTGSATTASSSHVPTPNFGATQPEIYVNYVNNDKYSPVDDPSSAYLVCHSYCPSGSSYKCIQSPSKSPVSPSAPSMSPLCLTDRDQFEEIPEDDVRFFSCPRNYSNQRSLRMKHLLYPSTSSSGSGSATTP